MTDLRETVIRRAVADLLAGKLGWFWKDGTPIVVQPPLLFIRKRKGAA